MLTWRCVAARLTNLCGAPGRNDDDLAGARIDRALADGEKHFPFLDDERLLVGMAMQLRSGARSVVAQEEGDLCAVPVAVERRCVIATRELL